MIEELARTKWCPWVRFSGESGDATFNRGSRDHMNNPEIDDRWVPRCIASDCMMWRVGRPTEVHNTCQGCRYSNQGAAGVCPPCNDNYSGWVDDSIPVGFGYCGLAGKL